MAARKHSTPVQHKHWMENAWPPLKADYNVSDREIAEVMMLASMSAAGTNLAWAKEVFEEKLG